MPSEANDVPAAPSEAVPLETAPSAAASVASGIPVSAVAGEPVLAEVEPMKTSAPANSEESSKSGEKRELGDSEGPIDSGSGAILMKEADCANGADDAPEETPAGESVTHPGAVNGAIDRGSVIDEPARMEIDSGKPSAELSTGTSAVREEQGIENQGGVGVDAGVDADAGSGAEKATGGEDSVKVGTPEAEEGTQTGPMVSIGLNVSRVNMFGLANYHFGRKETESKGQVARGVSEEEIAAHRQKRFEERGMRRSVAAVLLVHDHEFPHVLLLQQKGGGYSLPGGRLRPGESEEDGLRRKLHAKLSPVAAGDGEAPEWDIGDELGKWWGLDFSQRVYPYIPVHVSKPKEQLVLYSVTLPEMCAFAVPRNLELCAAPLFDLHGNAGIYGPVIASVPSLLSRIHINPL